MIKTAVCMTIAVLGLTPATGREAKEYDGNVIYDESKIPHYE